MWLVGSLAGNGRADGVVALTRRLWVGSLDGVKFKTLTELKQLLNKLYPSYLLTPLVHFSCDGHMFSR
jgi:hypothetical protein